MPLWYSIHNCGILPARLSESPEPESRNLACWRKGEEEDLQPRGEPPAYSATYLNYLSTCLSKQQRKKWQVPLHMACETELVLRRFVCLLNKCRKFPYLKRSKAVRMDGKQSDPKVQRDGDRGQRQDKIQWKNCAQSWVFVLNFSADGSQRRFWGRG